MNQNSPEDVSALLGDVNELVDNNHCHIDTSHIISAEIGAYNSSANGGHNEQSQCFDDDSFIQTAFGNPDLTCVAVASQGLCSTLAASGIDK